MAAKKKRGVTGACAIVVEQPGSKRKVVSDMAEARTLAKRLAERHPTKQVKITRACSTGRGARGETVGACTGRKCWGALSGAKGSNIVTKGSTTGEFYVESSDGKPRGFLRKTPSGWALWTLDGRVIERKTGGTATAAKSWAATHAMAASSSAKTQTWMPGMKGTVEQHEAAARNYAAAAHRALRHAAETADPKLRRTFLATAQKQIDAGQTECTWIPGRGMEPKACREVREASEALWSLTRPTRQRARTRERKAARAR